MSPFPYPTTRLLEDERAPLPEGMARVDLPITAGLPVSVELTKGLRLTLSMQSGNAVRWRDLDPTTVVSGSETAAQAEPEEPQLGSALARLARTVVPRVALSRNGRYLGSHPLLADARVLYRDTSDSGASAVVELRIERWVLHAGTVRGPGNFGSSFEFSWRAADQPARQFSTPPPDPVFVARQPPSLKLHSLLGVRWTGVRYVAASALPQRFLVKRSIRPGGPR